jgi:hypothetical protein
MSDALVRVDVAVHLASGKTIRTAFDVPDELDGDEVQALIHEKLTSSDRGTWTTLGELNVHTAAIQAVEIL